MRGPICPLVQKRGTTLWSDQRGGLKDNSRTPRKRFLPIRSCDDDMILDGKLKQLSG
jgi:hypothetical protein